MSRNPQFDNKILTDQVIDELLISSFPTLIWAHYKAALSSNLFDTNINCVFVFTSESTKKYFWTLFASFKTHVWAIQESSHCQLLAPFS